MNIKDDIEQELRTNPRFSLRYVDKAFWVLFLFLIAAALIALFSASSTLVYKSSSNIGPVAHQALFIFLGVVLAWCVQFMPSWMVRLFGYIGWVISLLMLYVMIIPHSPFVMEVNGAGRWFKLGGFSFQPSEFAKVGLMVVVADQLARAQDEEGMRKAFYRTLVITVLTVFPVLIGNLSTAILMSGIVFLLWIIAKVNWRYIIATVGIAAAVFVSGYFLVEFAFVRTDTPAPGLFKRATVWVKRVDDLKKEIQQPTAEFKLTDDNYQRSLAKVAVARGGASPLGVFPGNSKERDFLPLAYADYIFAIIVEETGLVGAALLIFLYLAVLFRACLVSARFGDVSAMLLTMGLALMLTCQTLISMAVAVGIGPVTGQPLPMITMGGTSSLATAMYFGIMMSVSREQNQILGEQEDVMKASMDNMPEIDLDTV